MPSIFEPYDDIPIYDGHVPEDLFAEFTARMPNVCTELLTEIPNGHLLARRDIMPLVCSGPVAVSTGGILTNATHRHCRRGVGIEITIWDRFGPYAHFWQTGSI